MNVALNDQFRMVLKARLTGAFSDLNEVGEVYFDGKG